MLSVVIGATLSVSTLLPSATSAATPVTYTCGGKNATLVGTPGNDLLIPRDGDVVVALEGNDTISATHLDKKGNRVIICGNQGNDRIYGSSGADKLYGGQGDDEIYGRDGDDYIEGNKGDDLIDGNYGSDIQYGNEDNDELYSSVGYPGVLDCGAFDVDKMYGGQGNDILDGGYSADHLEGNLGIDLIYGGSETWNPKCRDVCLTGEQYFQCEVTSSGAGVPLPQ